MRSSELIGEKLRLIRAKTPNFLPCSKQIEFNAPEGDFSGDALATQSVFKLHAWSALNGKIVKYAIRPANEHDFSVLCEMNRDWLAYGGPKQIGDKGYQSGTCLTPPKVNAKRVDPRWKPEYEAARKCVESAFSVLAGAGLRWG